MVQRKSEKKGYSYIRFSTVQQTSGDSLRRQTELAKNWCQRHGVELIENYQDLGVSAYRGKNAEKGALGLFLRNIENGKIPKGSFLLVESLDRISRDEIISAQAQFLSIIDAGIVVVTLTDEKIYDRSRINDGGFTDLIISLTILSRANEESRIKAKRLSAAWEQKRSQKDVKMTSRCVAWLELSNDRTKFIPVTSRVKTVNRIYKDYANGKGTLTIAKELNREKVETFGRAKIWHCSYVKKILDNPSVSGEFTPHKKVDGKRIPLDPIPDYYPAVVDLKLYAAVRRIRKSSHRSYRGRGKFNEFSCLTRDISSGCPLQYVNKNRTKGWHYLVSRDSIMGMAPYFSWQYDDFKKCFLFLINQSSFLKAEYSYTNELAALEVEVECTEKNIGKLTEFLLDGPVDAVSKKLRALEKQRIDLLVRVEAIQNKFQAGGVEEKLADLKNSETNLRTKIRSVVDRIEVDIENKIMVVKLLDGSISALVKSDDQMKIMTPDESLIRNIL